MKFAIVDASTLRVRVTSKSKEVIEQIFEGGFKTKWGLFKIINI